MPELTRSRALAVVAWLAWTAAAAGLHAQGPAAEYYLRPETTLTWARAWVSMGGGSTLPIAFLPVVLTGPRAPIGSHAYTTDLDVDAPLVFAGDGAVNADRDAYAGPQGPLDVAGKAVLLCYDCDLPAAETPKWMAPADRVAEAASRGAAAVVLFSLHRDDPFLTLDDDGEPTLDHELPVVTVSRQTADAIFSSSIGTPRIRTLASRTPESQPQELHARLHLHVDAAFAGVRTDRFRFLFRPDAVAEDGVRRIAAVHEDAIDFILGVLGKDQDRPWPGTQVVYFADFDSKVFFTHHWGWGLSSSAGTFLVWGAGDSDRGTIVHEHVHDFTRIYWGSSSSFLEEGIARHLEALATTPERNHEETRAFLAQGKVPPLGDLVGLDVGSDPLTPIAYPAAGSFVGYLIETYGLDRFQAAFLAPGDDRWTKTLDRTLEQLDRDWRSWLQPPAAP